MTLKENFSEKNSVQIKYNYSDSNSPNIGTGILIKGQDSQFYLITAKHTFSERNKRKDEKWRDVKIKELRKKLDCIVLTKNDNIEVCKITSIAFDYEDLIVFSVKNYIEKDGSNIKILYQKIYPDNIKFFFYGFCTKQFVENLTSPSEIKNKNYLYTIQDNQSNRIGAIKGCSGGGVFIEKNGDFYLVGILLQRYDDGASYTIFNLPKYLNENPQESFDICNRQNKNIDEVNENFSSHIIYRDGYIEPRTVYIKELDIHVAVCPVTFEEYDLFCEDIGKDNPHDNFFGKENRPVINISWHDAVEYCEWLSSKSDEKIYRLLTSNEWKNIAMKNQPQNNIISKEISHRKTSEVSIKRIGSLGISDMYGNIYEWCSDGEGEFRKAKGGSFLKSLNYILNLDNSEDFLNDDKSEELGFRIVFEKDYMKILTEQLSESYSILHKICLELIIDENKFLLYKYQKSYISIGESIRNISNINNNDIKKLVKNIENIKKDNDSKRQLFRYEPNIIESLEKDSKILLSFLKKKYQDDENKLEENLKFIDEIDDMIEYMEFYIRDSVLEKAISKIQKKV